jgi:peptidoglycan/LPS O-acetylase OafA/YrhL
MMQERKFETLDGARGIAAIAVVFFHLGLWTSNPWLVPHGYLAVDFFFCLSGFVIAFVYKDRLATSLPLSEFAIKRLIRLYPVILIGMTLGFLFYVWFSHVARNQPYSFSDVLKTYLLNAVLVPFGGHPWLTSNVGAAIYPLNSALWSIFYEVVINAAWAIFLRRIPAWLLFSGAVLASLWFFPALQDMSIGGGSNQYLWGILRVTLGFSAGLWIFELYEKGFRLPPVRAPVLLVILAIILVMPVSFGVWFDLTCAVVVFPLLTFAGVTATASGRLRSYMENLGRLSYPLYGVHRPFCQPITIVAMKLLPGPLGAAVGICSGVVISVTVGWLVLVRVDEPVRKYMGDVYRRSLAKRVRKTFPKTPAGSAP